MTVPVKTYCPACGAEMTLRSAEGYGTTRRCMQCHKDFIAEPDPNYVEPPPPLTPDAREFHWTALIPAGFYGMLAAFAVLAVMALGRAL